MNAVWLVAFNLLVNGIGSFLVGVLVAAGASRVVRRAPGRSAVWLGALPFAKVVFDLARGIPENSFLWQRAQGVTQDLGSFRLGFGLARFVPKLDFAFGAISRGTMYTQSAADVLASGLAKHLGARAPAVVVCVLVAGIAVRLARRIRAWTRAARERRTIVASPPREVRRVAWWRVPIHVVPDVEGSAYTGGVLRPFVVFPEPLWNALEPDEREAAIQHELAHVRDLHPMWMLATGIVSDVFWFVPWIDRARERLASACEIAADVMAVQRGADPVKLASALVRTRELSADAPPAVCSLGAARGALASRVSRLLDGDGGARRPSFIRTVARVAFVVWAAATVALSLPFGNH